MIQKHIVIILVFAFGLAVNCPSISGSEFGAFDQQDLLTRKIRATNIKGEAFDQVLAILASDYGIPVGIELGDSQLGPRRKIDLNLPETNLKDFLDAVFANDPQYTWKLEGGVIHVWPEISRDPLLATLLDTKISHFSFHEGTTRHRIHDAIMNLPEIRTKLIVAGVDPMIFLNSGTMVKVGKGIWLDETSLTLRELLDKIVQKTESKRWVFYRWGKNNEFITLTT